jgi:DNA-directed RNA polymerase specialized sigma24 family protein
MSSQELVTPWIVLLKAGDAAAAQPLWQAYFQRLIALARARLRAAPRRAADEEDVALSAFDSFCRAAARDRFPHLNDRHDLWQLLVLITARKAADLVHHERRQARGGGRVRTLSDLAGADLERALGPEPTPELAALLNEALERRLQRLADPELRQIALGKLEGYTNQELATRFDCTQRTIERKLERIRTKWESAPDDGP